MWGGTIRAAQYDRQYPPSWGCARDAPTPAQGAARIAPEGSTAEQQSRTHRGRAHCQKHAGGGQEGTEGRGQGGGERVRRPRATTESQRPNPTQRPPCVFVPPRVSRGREGAEGQHRMTHCLWRSAPQARSAPERAPVRHRSEKGSREKKTPLYIWTTTYIERGLRSEVTDLVFFFLRFFLQRRGFGVVHMFT